MTGRFCLKWAGNTYMLYISKDTRWHVTIQHLEKGNTVNDTNTEYDGRNELTVYTVFYMYPQDVHRLKLEYHDGSYRVSGSVATIGEISGEVEYFTGKTDFEIMENELKEKKLKNRVQRTDEEIQTLVEDLILRMTLEEKAGQLTQSIVGIALAIGDAKPVEIPVEDMIRQGMVGSMAALASMPVHYQIQKLAVENSRLGIPLLFCRDCLHGAETVFPIPLAWSCSFEPELVEAACRVFASEVTVDGSNYIFSPMCDISRDPRWGRVSEGHGEDPYLAGRFVESEVRGWQGAAPDARDGVIACLKHFIGYGAVEGGRDYNTVEISEITLRNTYLPPFLAGIRAGAGSIMPSFNVINGVPMSVNKKMLKGLLRDELGYDGLLICDFNSVDEAVDHGAAQNLEEAVKKALDATMDIHMVSGAYYSYIPGLVRKGLIREKQLDDAVRRVLTSKYKSGIMDDPYMYFQPEAARTRVFTKENRELSLKLAQKSIVLLKNNGVLPLDRKRKIALIGPKADSKDMMGPWTSTHHGNETVTLKEGLEAAGFSLICEEGCSIHKEIPGGMDRALEVARDADVVILALGEDSSMSGEASSCQSIELPKIQQHLAKTVADTGKPVVLVLTNGRPLILSDIEKETDAIVETWFLGTMAGTAIASVLDGTFNPSGKLTMSFPYSVGQIPVYYNHFNTGRPANPGDTSKFLSKYLDGPNEPLYPFGYGLSYTTFTCEDLELSCDELSTDSTIKVMLTVTNIGKRTGAQVVQLYIRDVAASIVRPVKELKGFQKISLAPGERRRVSFEITEEMLRFYNENNEFVSEKGLFQVMAGSSSRKEDLLIGTFTLI